MVDQSLQDAKDAKTSAIEEERGFYLVPPNGVNYMDTTFDLTLDTYNNISGVSAAVALNGYVPADFAWIDFNNNVVPMTLEQFTGFVNLVMFRLQYGFMHSNGLKQQVDAATTIEEVEAIPSW